MPNGVFAPYTIIPTNLLFFDRSGPTKSIWYYELPLPQDRKNFTKTRPIQTEDFDQASEWYALKRRKETDYAWKVPVNKVLEYGQDGQLLSCNLDQKNPRSADALEHLSPSQLVDQILARELRIVEIMEELKVELARSASL